MDFNNTPDFGDLPLPDAANSQTTPNFPPPPDFDTPQTPTEEMDAVAATSAHVDKKQFIYTLLIALFISLVIGGIGMFAVINYLKQNEVKTPPSKYTFGSGTATQPTKTPTPALKATPSTITPTETAENDWQIKMKETTVNMSTLANPQASTLSASVFGPVEEDSYVCTSNSIGDSQYFTVKKSGKVFERLCDSKLDPEPQKLTCTKYDADVGIPISQTIYPKTDCSKGSIEAGTYILYSKVYFDCDLAGKPLNDISSDACKDNTEVYSEEMTVEE